MNEYINAKELKRLVRELKERAKRNCCDAWGIVPDALEEVEDIIDSLQQEQPEADEPEYGPYARQYPKPKVSQEQPEVDLEQELKNLIRNSDNGCSNLDIARHFYELGIKARK